MRHWLTKLPMKLSTVSICLNTLISSNNKKLNLFLFSIRTDLFLKQENVHDRFIRLFVRTNIPLRREECSREIVMHEWHFKGTNESQKREHVTREVQ